MMLKIIFLTTLTHNIGHSASDSPPSHDQLRQARDDTALREPIAHSRDDHTASPSVTHKPLNVTQSTGDIKVSSLSTDSKHQPSTVSVPSNQREHTSLKDEYVQTTSENTSAAPQASSSSASIYTGSGPP